MLFINRKLRRKSIIPKYYILKLEELIKKIDEQLIDEKLFNLMQY